MKSQELRLGNWVMGNKPYQIDITNLVSFEYYEKIGTEYCQPIQLTEEWLFMFGFEKTKTRHLRIKIGMSSNKLETIYLRMYIYRGEVGGSIAKMTTKIQYVHELQNLYFALTGEELVAEPTCITKIN